MGGAPGAGGMPGGLPGLFGGAGGEKKKATDAWFTDRLPVLQKIKRPVLVAFFAYCFYQGWIGRYGLLQGAMSSSYFDMLAVPLRIRPESPLEGKAFFMTQIWVDSGSKLLGFLINLARGKAKIPTLQDFIPKPPTGGADAANPFGANPFGGAGANPFGGAGASPFGGADPFDVSGGVPSSPLNMPTARTTATPPPPPPSVVSTPPPAAPPGQGPPSRSAPPVVDADVTFLD